MREQDTTITLRVSKEWLAALDEWREQQEFKPSRSDVIRVAINRLIGANKEGK